MTRQTRVGVIGLGVMGEPMARNLARAGYPVLVHSRSEHAKARLEREGAHWSDSAATVGAAVDVALLALPSATETEDVLFGTRGLVRRSRSGLIVLDTATLDPSTARAFAGRLAGHDVVYLDAPISGGQTGAVEGTLSVFVGGPQQAVERARPLLDVIGASITHLGDVGSGQLAKACNQLIVGSTILAVAEALTLASAGGADPALVRAALLGGFADSRVLREHGARMIGRRFEPGARVALHLKDARVVGGLAAESGVAVSGFASVIAALESLDQHGLGGLDHAALILDVERRSPGAQPAGDSVAVGSADRGFA